MNLQNKFLFSLVLLTLLLSIASAADVSSAQGVEKVYFFYGDGCPHCANVEASGILEKVAQNVTLDRLEVWHNATNQKIFADFMSKLNIPTNQQGVPFVLIQYKDNTYTTLVGDTPILDNLQSEILKQTGTITPGAVQPTTKTLSIWAVVLAGLVDSLNPCAIGVLAFLMISLLKLGSSRRALKAGIIYSFVVFFVYFLSGFGVFKLIQSFSIASHYIYLGAGILVLVLGALQFIDFLAPGKFITLRIPLKAKPMIERIATKGTLPAIIALGAIVALFELPCTGGIYIGILTLISSNPSSGIKYLALYNLLFILPLLVMTFIIYKGTKPEMIERWSQKEKGWMKLASAIVMIALGIYILMF